MGTGVCRLFLQIDRRAVVEVSDVWLMRCVVFVGWSSVFLDSIIGLRSVSMVVAVGCFF